MATPKCRQQFFEDFTTLWATKPLRLQQTLHVNLGTFIDLRICRATEEWGQAYPLNIHHLRLQFQQTLDLNWLVCHLGIDRAMGVENPGVQETLYDLPPPVKVWILTGALAGCSHFAKAATKALHHLFYHMYLLPLDGTKIDGLRGKRVEISCCVDRRYFGPSKLTRKSLSHMESIISWDLAYHCSQNLGLASDKSCTLNPGFTSARLRSRASTVEWGSWFATSDEVAPNSASLPPGRECSSVSLPSAEIWIASES